MSGLDRAVFDPCCAVLSGLRGLPCDATCRRRTERKAQQSLLPEADDPRKVSAYPPRVAGCVEPRRMAQATSGRRHVCCPGFGCRRLRGLCLWLRPFSASLCSTGASPDHPTSPTSDLRGWQGHGLDSGPHWGRTRTVRMVPSDRLLYADTVVDACKASNQLEQNVGKVRILGFRLDVLIWAQAGVSSIPGPPMKSRQCSQPERNVWSMAAHQLQIQPNPAFYLL